MDPHRFDRLSKAFASRISRRAVLGAVGAGGLAAAALGDDPTLAAADRTTCVYAFDGTIDVGPSSLLPASSEVGGELTLTINADGAIDSGSLKLADGSSWKVVGHTTGRAVNLRISVPNTGAIIAVGTGRKAFGTCPAAMGGPASGPLRRDLGSWTAALTAKGDNSSPPATVVAATATISAAGTDAQPSPTEAPVESSPATEPTSSATTACDIQCWSNTLGIDPNACACLCPDGLTSCTFEIGSIPAKGGVIFRPGPLKKPTGFCIDITTDSSNCGGCGTSCYDQTGEATASCVGGVCVVVVCPAGLQTCPNAAPCTTDVSTDVKNCGNCGLACVSAGSTCVGGACVCANDCGAGNSIANDCTCRCANSLESCIDRCADTLTDPNNCGQCGVVCQPFEPNCSGGVCRPLAAA